MPTTSLSTIQGAGVLALVIDAGVVFIGGWFATREQRKTGDHGWILPLLRDHDKGGLPSLSKFQLLLWTAIASFAVLWVSFVRLFSGLDALMPQLPTNLLGIVGIGIITTPISVKQSEILYVEGRKKLIGAPNVETVFEKREKELKDQWSSMLLELKNGKYVSSLTRLQMFLWTITGVTIYALVLLGTMSGTAILTATETLSIPDLDEVFVGLMGLSQVGFVAGKAAKV